MEDEADLTLIGKMCSLAHPLTSIVLHEMPVAFKHTTDFKHNVLYKNEIGLILSVMTKYVFIITKNGRGWTKKIWIDIIE